MGKVNPDGTHYYAKTFEGNGSMVVRYGGMNITREERKISEDELFSHKEIKKMGYCWQ